MRQFNIVYVGKKGDRYAEHCKTVNEQQGYTVHEVDGFYFIVLFSERVFRK